MARQWLSFWNQETRRRQSQGGTSRTGTSTADIYVPYGQGNLAVGDTVYCVAVDGGELLLFDRVTVVRIDVDPDNVDSLDVWAEPGARTGFRKAQTVDEAAVDGLVFLKADGSEGQFRRVSGAVLGNAFQGSASLRELARGSEALDLLVHP